MENPNQQLLTSIKLAAGRPGPQLCLPVGSPPTAWLRPVATQNDRLNAKDIECLTQWRNRFVTAFLTEFTATEHQTARWLTGSVGSDNTRILFMVDSAEGVTFAYLGLAFIDWQERSGEADSVVRGGPAPSGTMTGAMKTLVGWARGQLGLKTIQVRVRSDNPALAFYAKLGFQEIRRVPLRSSKAPGKIVWVEDSSISPETVSLVHMRLPDQS
jgi:hypothetical protein